MPALLLCGALVAWAQLGEPPEIERSRALRLGMTESEVVAVMGRSPHGRVQRNGSDYYITQYFGRSQDLRLRVYDAVVGWMGDGLVWSPFHEDWPVRVRFDRRPPQGRVDRIERGSDVEAAAEDSGVSPQPLKII